MKIIRKAEASFISIIDLEQGDTFYYRGGDVPFMRVSSLSSGSDAVSLSDGSLRYVSESEQLIAANFTLVEDL